MGWKSLPWCDIRTSPYTTCLVEYESSISKQRAVSPRKSKTPEFLLKRCCLSYLWVPSDAWCLTFSFSHPFVFIFLLTFLYLPFPFLPPTGTVTLCFSNDGFNMFSLHPFIQTNSAVHTMRWRPGAQWWLSCMALSHVLNPAWHSGGDQGWRSIFCPATEQWWRRIETKGADPRGGCTFETRALWAKTLPS